MNRGMSFRNIVSGIVALHFVVTAMSLFILGESYLLTEFSHILIISIDLLIVFGLYFFLRECVPLILVFVLFYLIFFAVRLGSFMIFPAQAIGFIEDQPYTAQEIESALSYVVIGTIALFLGMNAAAATMRRIRAPSLEKFYERLRLNTDFVTTRGLLMLWAAAFASQFLVQVVLQGSVFSEGGSEATQFGWFIRFFDTDVALVITICWLILRRDLQRRDVVIAVLLIACWIISSMLWGSRGGPMRVGFILFIVCATLLPIRLFTMRAFVFAALLVIAGSVIAGFVGNVMRTALVGVEDPLTQAVFDMTRQDIYSTHQVDSEVYDVGVPSERGSLQATLRNELEESPLLNDMARALNQILTRLGAIDYAVLTITREADQAAIDHFMRSTYPLRIVANNLVIGDIFNDVSITTARVIPIAYRGASLEMVERSVSTETWTIWGLAHVSFGPVLGLLFLFVVGAVLQAGYGLLGVAPLGIAPYLKTMYLFIAVFQTINIFGLDHQAILMIHMSIATASAFAVLYLATWFDAPRRLDQHHTHGA